jgi:subtilase family serine protease
VTQSASTGAVARLSVLFSRIFLAVIMVLAGFCTTNAQLSSGSNVVLVGNHPAEATTMSPVAHANSAARLNMEVTLALRNTTALEQLLRDQQDPTSPRFHQWLAPGQFTAQFGPSQPDADTVAQWLTSQGFQVTAISLQGRYVRFSGSVANAERVFATDIMAFGDGSSYSNTTDPMIPAQFAGVIGGIRGLNNFLHSVAFSHRPSSSISPATSAWTGGLLALLDAGPVLPLPQRNGITAVPNVIVGGIGPAFGPSVRLPLVLQ